MESQEEDKNGTNKPIQKWIEAFRASLSGANGADLKGSGCLVE